MKTYINGWTRETVEAHVRATFKGKAVAKEEYGDSCKYRTEDEETGTVLKCIAGCFIPDNLYSESLEGLSAVVFSPTEPMGRNGTTEQTKKISEFMPFEAHLMVEWQKIHDALIEETSLEEQTAKLIAFLDTI